MRPFYAPRTPVRKHDTHMPHPTSRRPRTPAQSAVLAHLTREQGPQGTTTTSEAKIAAAVAPDFTLKQVQNAMRGLEAEGVVTKQWDPDRYLWVITLTAAANF